VLLPVILEELFDLLLALLPQSLLELEASDGTWVEQSSLSASAFKHGPDKHRRLMEQAPLSKTTGPLPRRRDFAMGPMDEVGCRVTFATKGNGDHRAPEYLFPPLLGVLACEVEVPWYFFSEMCVRLSEARQHAAHNRRCSKLLYCAV